MKIKPFFRLKIFIPVCTCLLFLAIYIILNRIEKNQWVTKTIQHHSAEASELYIVWNTFEDNADSIRWPAGSQFKSEMIWTPLVPMQDQFKTDLQLHPDSHLYYWIVQTKSIKGDTNEVWDSGGEQQFYLERIKPERDLHPGIFFMLALLIPLFLVYFFNRRSVPTDVSDKFQLPTYIPQLNVIRAFAVILVIIHHWIPEKSFIHKFPNGPMGVNLFFVLSGFLITGILLQSKKIYEEGRLKGKDVFLSFYIRRTLRIFPIYYLFLLILWGLNDDNVRKDAAYYFSYTSNYLFYQKEVFPGRVAHLWSLGVEEQFYLLWPWLIVFIRRKYLSWFILAVIVVGISTSYLITNKDNWVMILTPACLDAFAIGGFLSFLIAYRQDLLLRFNKIFPLTFLFSVGLLFTDLFDLHILPARTIHSILAIHFIFYCLFRNNIKAVNFILNSKWLIRIGKISYGIYLYHLVIPELWDYVYDHLKNYGINFLFTDSLNGNWRSVWIFIQQLGLLLLVAALSWQFIEKPINGLKKYFYPAHTTSPN